MTLWLACLCLALAHFKGHGQGQLPISIKRWQIGQTLPLPTNRKLHAGFRLADLYFILAYSRGKLDSSNSVSLNFCWHSCLKLTSAAQSRSIVHDLLVCFIFNKSWTKESIGELVTWRRLLKMAPNLHIMSYTDRDTAPISYLHRYVLYLTL